MGDQDTIFALSSGRPPAAIAVIRISGPRARFGLEALCRRVPHPRQVSLARLRDPASEQVIDEALVLWLPGPRTEVGEDMAELHLHGGRAVIAATLAALGRLDGFRPAEPGEFTRRAFANGKLDLTAVEGLADLIYAETEAQRRQAYRQLKGVLGTRAESWRQRLIAALALIEARIDFAEDVPDDLIARALDAALQLREEICGVLADDRRGERLRDGSVVTIAGPPNVGKSSLLNRIARRDAAIVSPYAGTTRDIIEVHLDLDGYPVTLLDTAGIRPTEDPVELEGVRRARARAEIADLVLWMIDASAPDGADLAGLPSSAGSAPVWIIRNKIDLIRSASKFEGKSWSDNEGRRTYSISALTGTGIDELISSLAVHARDSLELPEPALVTRERHRVALRETTEALDRALNEGVSGRDDIVAEELRLAGRALGRVTGRVDVENILDVIFRDFCIGK
jgi:tRNA modification GTPase